MANKIPEVLHSFRVYNEGADNCLGIATVDLPELANMSQTISGVGIAGEVDAPILGQYSSMEVTLNWRTPNKEAINMGGGAAVALEVRGAIQNWESGASEYQIDAIRVVIRGRVKSLSIGTFETANTTDTSNTIEATYIKIEIGGKTVREIDKYAAIDSVNGSNTMLAVQEALGLL